MAHFSGDWTSYFYFAKWADFRLLTAPGSPILLEGWLQSKCGGGDGLRDGAASETQYCLESLGGIVTDNMCNKTCNPPLLIVGEIITIAGHRDALAQDAQGSKPLTVYPVEEASEEEKEEDDGLSHIRGGGYCQVGCNEAASVGSRSNLGYMGEVDYVNDTDIFGSLLTMSPLLMSQQLSSFSTRTPHIRNETGQWCFSYFLL